MFSSSKSKLESISHLLIEQNSKCQSLLQENEIFLLTKFKKGVDSLGAKYLKQLEQIINEEKTNLIMISVGSAGSEIQERPEYALTQSSKTIIINIDPKIEYKKPENIKDNISLYFLSTMIDNKQYPKTYTALNELIKNAITASKNIIFTFYTSPFCLLEFKDIILTNKDALEKNLTIISAYHAYQSVLVYNKELTELLDNNFKTIIPALRAIFYGERKTLAELDKIQIQYPSLAKYAKIYDHLSKLNIEEIIKMDLSSSNEKKSFP